MSVKLRKNIIEYVAVLIGILGMGSLYFQVLRMPLMAAMLLFASALLLMKKRKIKKYNFILYGILTLCFLMSTAINYKNGFHVNDLIIWIVNAVFVIALQTQMSFYEFQKKFVILMTFEAVLSIICFLWANIGGHTLPLQATEAIETNAYYLTPYYTLGWRNVGVFDRNAGWFGEPGFHQIFLNFAILFLGCDEKHFGLKKRNYIISLCILVAALLTTKSTAGYMCLAVVLVAITLKKKKGTRNVKMIIFAILALAALAIIEYRTGVVKDKFQGIAIGQGSGRTRLNDTVYGYLVALSRPILGHGMFMDNMEEMLSEYGITNISNGMAAFSIHAGIPMTLGMLALMYISIKKKFHYGTPFCLCVFAFFLMCINTQGIFLNILFMAFWGEWREPAIKPTYSIRPQPSGDVATYGR